MQSKKNGLRLRKNNLRTLNEKERQQVAGGGNRTQTYADCVIEWSVDVCDDVSADGNGCLPGPTYTGCYTQQNCGSATCYSARCTVTSERQFVCIPDPLE